MIGYLIVAGFIVVLMCIVYIRNNLIERIEELWDFCLDVCPVDNDDDFDEYEDDKIVDHHSEHLVSRSTEKKCCGKGCCDDTK